MPAAMGAANEVPWTLLQEWAGVDCAISDVIQEQPPMEQPLTPIPGALNFSFVSPWGGLFA